ncbi:MAG: insulinase family protein, partial [Cyanothece sp. SIO1E1]|nr:insulinase family protein [Cyanothece sp. SIO1E1]
YQDHPYALSGLGTEATVASLSREILQHYHQTYYRPDNMVVSLAGRINSEEAVALVQQMFGDWQAPTTPLPTAFLPTVTPEPNQVIKAQETQQSIVMLGYLAAPAKSDDYPTLKLLSTYLGNGLSSRLFTELREKRGLAYEVSAFYPTRLATSQFVAYMGTAPHNTAIALEGLQHELERLCAVPLTANELQATQNKMLGQYALGKQTNAQLAQIAGWYETIGVGIDFDQHFQAAIADVSLEQAQAVANRYFQSPYISLLGPAAMVDQWVVPKAS